VEEERTHQRLEDEAGTDDPPAVEDLAPDHRLRKPTFWFSPWLG